ncbi:MAG: helix-turn-helix domain-containing protein [Verrucomicrobiae bacterium]
MILLLCQQMPVSAFARHLGETDTRLWRALDHYVTTAHAAKDWSGVCRVMIDETSTKKGHNCATNFMEAESKGLLFTVEGKASEVCRHANAAAMRRRCVFSIARTFPPA